MIQIELMINSLMMNKKYGIWKSPGVLKLSYSLVPFQIISGTTPGHHGPGSNGSITSNKTGTLNTKAVTASQLATNSPILPHKMNGNNTPAPPSKNDPLSNGRHGGLHQKSGPPALPPRGVSIRSRDGSMNRDQVKPPPPAVPPKRSSLTRSDLALFSAENVSILIYFTK